MMHDAGQSHHYHLDMTSSDAPPSNFAIVVAPFLDDILSMKLRPGESDEQWRSRVNPKCVHLYEAQWSALHQKPGENASKWRTRLIDRTRRLGRKRDRSVSQLREHALCSSHGQLRYAQLTGKKG